MSQNIQKFSDQILADHREMTEGFLKLQADAEAAWAKYSKAKHKLAAFRRKYGPVIQALEKTADVELVVDSGEENANA